MRKIVTATAVLALSAGAAMANGAHGKMDEPVVEPIIHEPPAPGFNWTGGYAGVFVGLPLGSEFWDSTVGAQSTPGDWSGTPWGAMLGYNFQRGNMVLGGEIDYTVSTLTGISVTNPGPNPPAFACNIGNECVTDVNGLFSLRARAGIAMDRTLFYGTAGIAFGRVTGTTFDAADDPFVHGEENRTGWTAGVGVEHAITNRLTLRGEYIHTDLGRTDLLDACGGCFTDVSFGVVRIGGAFRF